MTRSLRDSDIDKLEEINKQQDFKLYDFNHRIIDAISEVNHEIIAYGIVKRQAEAIILLDKTKPRVARAKALRELMLIAEHAAAKAGCQQLICSTKEENVAKLLSKHFNFVRCSDILMVRNL